MKAGCKRKLKSVPGTLVAPGTRSKGLRRLVARQGGKGEGMGTLELRHTAEKGPRLPTPRIRACTVKG